MPGREAEGTGILAEVRETHRAPLAAHHAQDPVPPGRAGKPAPVLLGQAAGDEADHPAIRIHGGQGPVAPLEESAGKLHDAREERLRGALGRQGHPGLHQRRELFPPPANRALALLDEGHGHDGEHAVDHRLVGVQGARLVALPRRAGMADHPPAHVAEDEQPADDLLRPDAPEDVPLGHLLGIRLGAVVAPRLQAFEQRVVEPGALGLRLLAGEVLAQAPPRHLVDPAAPHGLALPAQQGQHLCREEAAVGPVVGLPVRWTRSHGYSSRLRTRSTASGVWPASG
jgi:hypothetical protein